jgi:hypothetical protein
MDRDLPEHHMLFASLACMPYGRAGTKGVLHEYAKTVNWDDQN